jgi:hypothetical protein
MRCSNRKIQVFGVLAAMILIPAILAVAAEPAGKAAFTMFAP